MLLKNRKMSKERVASLLKDYLTKLALLRKEHDELLREFIKALEKAKEEEIRKVLMTR